MQLMGDLAEVIGSSQTANIKATMESWPREGSGCRQSREGALWERGCLLALQIGFFLFPAQRQGHLLYKAFPDWSRSFDSSSPWIFTWHLSHRLPHVHLPNSTSGTLRVQNCLDSPPGLSHAAFSSPWACPHGYPSASELPVCTSVSVIRL